MCTFTRPRGCAAVLATRYRAPRCACSYIVSDQGAAYGILTEHKYANSTAQAAAYAVKGGLDLEDADRCATFNRSIKHLF